MLDSPFRKTWRFYIFMALTVKVKFALVLKSIVFLDKVFPHIPTGS
jgi:hypothetical protein